MNIDKLVMGNKIKEARLDKRYTQEFLAEAVELSDRTINLIENGKCGMSIKTLARFCDILDVSPNYILSYNHKDKNLTEDIPDNFNEKQIKIINEFLIALKKIYDEK